MEWATFFPINCPPQNTKPASGVFYRVITDKKVRPLKEKDFHSQRKSQPNREWPQHVDPCELCGVSITQTLDDSIKTALMLLGRVPALRNRISFIAKGDLQPNMGVIKHTPNVPDGILSHHDWWVPEGVDPLSVFFYCGEKVENPKRTDE